MIHHNARPDLPLYRSHKLVRAAKAYEAATHE